MNSFILASIMVANSLTSTHLVKSLTTAIAWFISVLP